MHKIMFTLLIAVALPVRAADWQPVTSDHDARIEVDRHSVLPSDQGTKIAWMRMVLAPAEAARQGYSMVKALSRYDCRGNHYATIKRVYLREDMTVVREERVEHEGEVPIKSGSADDKVLHEVCPTPTPSDIRKVALQAAEAGKNAEVKSAVKATEVKTEAKKPLVDIRPTLHHADLKAEAEAAKSELKSVPKPAREDKPAVVAETTPAGKSGIPLRDAKPHADEASLQVMLNDAVRRAREREAKAAARPPQGHATTRAKLAMAAPSDTHEQAKDTHSGAEHEVHWSYDGETGPDNWGKLKPEWKTCAAGERQSPIDIRDGIRVDQEPIKFDYKPSAIRIVDNGHTVQVNVGAGNGISIMGKEFELVQFHFHRPSEERVNGKLHDMVAHLVHKDKEGKLAVVAVLLDHGDDNPVVQMLWNNLPLDKGLESAPAAALDLKQLLPANRAYFAYMGSLTTPPCSEGVLWLVLKNPASVSSEQVDAFARLYRNNARPIQQARGRTIRESR